MGYASRYGKKPCCTGCSSDVATGAMTSKGRLTAIGADDATPSTTSALREALSSDFVKTASSIALTYHGYRRTGSLVWALLYGLAGRMLPTVAVPVAFAQGYGVRKPCP